MTYLLRRLLAVSALLAAPGAAQAQGTTITPDANEGSTRVATRGANFLHIGVGARQQGMAGAAIGLSDGPSAIFWNPAGISGNEGASALVSHMQLFGNSGITNTAAAVTVAVGQGAFGFGFVQYSSGKIERTTERAPDGDDPAFPGTFAWHGTALSGHYSRNVTDRLSAGIGARYATEGIEFAKNGFFGVDISTRFRTGLYGLTVGAALSNVGSSGQFSGPAVGEAITASRDNGQATGRDLPINYDTQDALMPTAFKFGLLSSVIGSAESLMGTSADHSLAAEIDFNKAIDSDLQSAIGLEYGFRRVYFLRAGKRFFNEQNSPWSFTDGLAVGGGARFPIMNRSLTFDYAFVSMGELRNNQIFSFEIGQ